MESTQLLPFLKWAGGKRWLASGHTDLFPDEYNRYFEPFLGSAAVFFRLQPTNASLSDTNSELIETYQALKDDHLLVRRYLAEHNRQHDEKYYYQIRSCEPRSKYTRAARFIYLNRTCWNALYRVNLNGQFNVPKGTKDSVLLPTDNFAEVSRKLQNARLICCDFEQQIDEAGDGDFVFADPPYTVKHNLNGFVKYNEKIFSWDDQIRLRDSLVSAASRGARILLTNANHRSIRDLYRHEFNISKAMRHSVIAASANKRSQTSELLISNSV